MNKKKQIITEKDIVEAIDKANGDLLTDKNYGTDIMYSGSLDSRDDFNYFKQKAASEILAKVGKWEVVARGECEMSEHNYDTSVFIDGKDLAKVMEFYHGKNIMVAVREVKNV